MFSFSFFLYVEIANCGRDIAFFSERLHKDTRQWLFEDFNTWLSNPGDSRAYVLLGDAGVGKSVIAGALAQQMIKTRQLGAAYFCRHNDGTRNDPRNLLGTIACQLCDCNCEYSSRMGGEDGVKMFLANSNLGVQELCTKLLEEPLSKCSSFQRKLVVIDALDETEYKSRKDFICLIKERFPRLPEWLVFFITSRPEDMLQSRLEKYNPCVRICAGNSEQRNFYQQHEQDIQRYLEKTVNFSGLPYSVKDVVEKCSGLFLYAFFVAKELNSALHSGKVDQVGDSFPGDIEDFFEKNLKRVYVKVGADLYRKLLGSIIAAPSPLPVSFISFILGRENSSLNEQKVIDAVSLFVGIQKTISFLHNLIPAWLTNKKKAQELYIDEKRAGEFLAEIVKEVLSAFVGDPGMKLKFIERDLQSCIVHFGIRLLCQHGEEDSLELVFRCLTSYHFLEEKIRSGRFGIYHLLKDFQYAASCLAVEEKEKHNILQETYSALESDVHVLVESPQLLRSCILNASDVVQENVLVPQVSSRWFEWNILEFSPGEILSRCNCFATASDKQTVVGADGRFLFFFSASMLQIVSGPFELSKDTISKITHLEFSLDGKFIFFGRLDKWFSVDERCVEDIPQFTGNDIHYQWGLITTDRHYIAANTRNVLHFPAMCERGCCLTELVALWAGKEIENSREEERTCSFDELSNRIAGIGIMGRHTRHLMKCLGVDPRFYKNHVMFVPDDPSCYFCRRLKKLAESSKELCLEAVRQLIIDLYPRLFQYQIWNLQSGQPLLRDVFDQDAQLNPFAYFCHVTVAYDPRGKGFECSGVVNAISVCNIAVVTAVYFLLQLELERCVNGQLSKILWLEWERTREDKVMSALLFLERLEERLSKTERPLLRVRDPFFSVEPGMDDLITTLKCINWVKVFAESPRGDGRGVKHGVEQFCNSFKSDFFMHFPEGFLNLLRNEFSRCISPGKNWLVDLSVNGRLELTRIQNKNPRKITSTKDEHKITEISHFTFTNDDGLVVYSSMKNSLHAVCLQTGKVFTSVSGCDSGLFKREKQRGYLFRSSGEERVVFLKSLCSPFKFLRFCAQKFDSMMFSSTMFSSSHTVTCISPASVVSLWNFKDHDDFMFFKIITSFPLSDSPGTLASPPKYVFSPDGKFITLQQKDKITLHWVEESQRYHCTVFPLSDSPGTLASPPKYVFSPDGKFIALQQKDKITLHCVEESQRYHCRVFPLSDSPGTLASPLKYVFSPHGKLIALQQKDKITLHCVEESQRYHCTVFEGNFGVVDACLQFFADSSLLFLCIQDSLKGPHLNVWDIRKKAMSHSFESPGLLLTLDCFCISSDMSYLILCGGYNEIEVCEFKNLKDSFSLLQSVGVEKFYNSVKFSLCIVSQDNELLVCCIANLIYVYKLTVANIYSSRKILRGHLGKIEFCRFLKGNLFLISYSVDGVVFLWNITESKAIGFARIAHREEKIVSMAVSPKEDRAVCFLSSVRVCEITLCKLECALSSKLLTALTEGKLDVPETKTQLAKHMPSTSNIPTSSLEDYKPEPSWNSYLEEDFYIPEDYFFESDESD